MRIISQNGNADLPYEKTLIFHAMEYVLARCEGYDKEIVLGEYSSMEKAYRAMEMLREAYAGKPVLNIDKLPNLTPQDFREKLGCGDILLCNKPSVDVSFSNNYYFQFPKDDEVEV